MKKLFLIWIVLLVELNGFGQDCIIFKDDTFNCVDSNKLRQGLWKVYDIRYELDESPIWMNNNGKLVDISNESCLPKNVIDSFLVVSEYGYYKDNKKVGDWEYINNGGCLAYPYKIEHYDEDGSFDMEEVEFKIHYNSDSTLVRGVTTFSKDTVYLNCLNKLCKTSFDNKVLFEFKQTPSDIDTEIIKIVGLVYHRKIQLIKSKKTSPLQSK